VSYGCNVYKHVYQLINQNINLLKAKKQKPPRVTITITMITVKILFKTLRFK